MKVLPFKLIWLCGMPRSGTNWLSQIFDSNEDVNFKLSPLFSYSFKDRVHSRSTKEEWLNFFLDVFRSDDDFLNQIEKRSSGIFPVFEQKNEQPSFLVIKETRYHDLLPVLLKRFSDIRIIYIVRNPCGAINSWISSRSEFPANSNPLIEWKTGKCRKADHGEYWGFDDWKLLTKQYLDLEKEYPKNVKVISYESLVEESSNQTKEMFDFVGLDLSKQTQEFLEISQSTHSEHGNAVFKSKEVKNKWKTELDPRIIEGIKQELDGSELESYFYK